MAMKSGSMGEGVVSSGAVAVLAQVGTLDMEAGGCKPGRGAGEKWPRGVAGMAVAANWGQVGVQSGGAIATRGGQVREARGNEIEQGRDRDT